MDIPKAKLIKTFQGDRAVCPICLIYNDPEKTRYSINGESVHKCWRCSKIFKI